tara:strand:- start:3598 stop:3879 length:282 start_codon:yes stop_codon:yes gene_type:complete
MNIAPSGNNTPSGSGNKNYPYNVLKILREERDNLVNQRNHRKQKMKFCEDQEDIWKQQRLKFREELIGINESIIDANIQIKIEIEKINDIAES